jgi:hypothetical protein
LLQAVRIWIASGHTDMRKGMQGLALLVQEGRGPFAGDVFVFCGRAGSLIKALCDSISLMKAGVEALPDDVETLKAALIVALAEAAAARAQQSDEQALIAHLKLQIEKLNRDRYGPRSERTARLLDQLELTREELETAATEDELAAEMAAAKTTTTTTASFTRKRPSHKRIGCPRTRARAGTCCLHLLRRIAAVQAWRGHHRDTGVSSQSLGR